MGRKLHAPGGRVDVCCDTTGENNRCEGKSTSDGGEMQWSCRMSELLDVRVPGDSWGGAGVKVCRVEGNGSLVVEVSVSGVFDGSRCRVLLLSCRCSVVGHHGHKRAGPHKRRTASTRIGA